MKFNAKYLWGLIPLAIIGYILYFFSDIVMYIVLAWVVSMLGAPLMRFFKRFVSKNVAAIFTLISFVSILFLILWTFIPTLTTQAKNISSVDYEQLATRLEEPILAWENWLESKGLIAEQKNEVRKVDLIDSMENNIVTHWIDVDSLKEANGDTSGVSNQPIAILIQINNPNSENQQEAEILENKEISFFKNFRQSAIKVLNPAKIQNVFGSIIGFFGNIVIAMLSIFFISFFFLREQGLFNNMIASVLPTKYEKEAKTAIDQTSTLLIRYFIGIALQVFTITIFVSLALKLLGVPNALLIGFFAALMNVVPYIGPLFGALFGLIITISSNLDLSFNEGMLPMLIKVLIVIGIMQLLDNFILQPNIFGKSVKAHPLEIFLVVLIGAKLGGIVGMVIAIPTYTVLRVVGKVFFSEFKVVQRITQDL